MLALALAPPSTGDDEADPMQITRAIHWKWHEAFEMAGGVATGREPDDAWLSSFVDVVSEGLVAGCKLPSWLWTDDPTDDHTMVSLGFTADEIQHWHVVKAIIKCEDDEDRQLEQLDLLLTASQVGIIDGLPIDELAELKSEWRRSYGGSRSDVAAQGGKSSGKGGGQSSYPRDSQEGSRPSSRPTPTSPSRPTPRPSARPMPKRRPHQADPIIYPAAGSSSTWGSGPAARSLAPPPLVLPPLTYRASSTWELRPVVVPRGSVERALKEEEPPPPAEGQQPDALRHQMDFVFDVCHVPIEAVAEKQWALWRNQSNWTVLHLMAEHINARRAIPGWLDLVQVEDFITLFKQRGGDIDAFTDEKDNAEPGSTALHIVTERWQLRHEMHDDSIRFAQALIVQGKANVNLATIRAKGRAPLSIAIGANRVQLACLLVKHGADPHLRDSDGLTVWEACDKTYAQACDEVRRYIQKLLEEENLKRRRITEL